MDKILIAATIILLSSCSSLLPAKATDTREWFTTDCNNASGWDICHKKAGARCPSGYDIANKEENMLTGLRKFEFACRK